VPNENLKKRLLSHVFFLIFLLFFLNSAAMYFSWYWTLPWFDIPMHFLGGFWAFLFLNYLYLFTPLGKIASPAIFLVSGLIFIGLAWEIFEFVFDRIGELGVITIRDSIKDLIFDFLGGGAAYFYLKYIGLWQTRQ